ncbi:MAG: LytTR family DNA-binding domain-containing protein [Bacteroidota bacterium]
MLKAYVLEDEMKAVNLLQNYVERIDFIKWIGFARSTKKASHFLQNNEIDLLFLDINLPDASGIEFYQHLTQAPAVIFTTAYPNFAAQGFDLEAIDYLVKPINFPRFFQACKRAVKYDQVNRSHEKMNIADESSTVYIKSGTLLHKVFWKDILFLEKDENYVIYHTKEKRILSRQTLNDLEAIFPNYFVRVHKSYAVSLLHIEQVSRDGIKIGKHHLPIGRTYKADFLECLNS